jgi:quinol monooxygenase YgiN
MLLLLADLTARSSSTVEVENVLRSLLEVAREEPGNVAYAVHRPRDDAGRFLLYGLYVDQAACDAHMAREPVKAALIELVPLLVGPPGVRFCTTVATLGIDGRNLGIRRAAAVTTIA